LENIFPKEKVKIQKIKNSKNEVILEGFNHEK